MKTLARFRGRDLTEDDVRFIQDLISAHPASSRLQLSRQLCEAWNWRQPNGELREMVCRGLMLKLHREGLIELPAPRCQPPNNVIARSRRLPVSVDRTVICGRLAEIGPLQIQQVRRTAEERLFDALIEEHHYLGYVRPVGEHLKYVVSATGRPVALLAFSSAPRHLGPRDRFIGWSAGARRRNTRFLAYNTRFLILPWVQVRHLASHVLAKVASVISRDWERLYAHPIYYLETFVDPRRFLGTCYRAANWIFLGPTTGRGHNDRTHRATQPKKEVLGLPLVGGFRELLSSLP